MERKGVRDSLVVATKYTMNWRSARTKGQVQSNFVGNSAKSMHMSIKDSLKKLRTDYIDIVRSMLLSIFSPAFTFTCVASSRKEFEANSSPAPAPVSPLTKLSLKFYVHWWDYTTSVEEVMHGLNRLVLAGEVLYLGISDTPAWIVSKANQCKIF